MYSVDNIKMNISQYVDPKRCLQLVTGVVGIYFSYLVTGILHESMYSSSDAG